jgi:hypothetical protein
MIGTLTGVAGLSPRVKQLWKSLFFMAEPQTRKGRAKRHHYLPQSYQQRFTQADGLLCLFDRETRTFRRQSPVNTALQNEFYTITNKEGTKSDVIEQQMLARLDGVANDVIRRLEARHTGWKDEQERVCFAIFLALFYTRTPIFDQEQTVFSEHLYRAWMKSNFPTASATTQVLEKLARKSGEELDQKTAEAFFTMIRDDQYDVDVPREHIIKLMVDLSLDFAATLLMLEWTFVHAPADLAFITSDAPFMIAPPPGMENDPRAYGILTPGAAATIPLSPSTCLVMQQGEGGKDRYGGIRKEAARHINENVAKNSDRFIIARDMPYLERLVKRTRVDQYRWNTRLHIQEGELSGDLLFHAKRTGPPTE